MIFLPSTADAVLSVWAAAVLGTFGRFQEARLLAVIRGSGHPDLDHFKPTAFYEES